jgi:hypothetical protein
VNSRQHAERYLLLNALVASNKSMEIRTAVFSKTNFDSLLAVCPAAIAFAPPGVLDAERLLGAYLENDALFRPITKSKRITSWRCYAQKPGKHQLEFKELVDQRTLLKNVVKLLKQYDQTSADAPVCVLLPDIGWTSRQHNKLRSVLWDVIAHSGSASKTTMVEAKRIPQAVSAEPLAPRDVSRTEDDSTDREALIRARRQMLEKVGSYSSEDLAAAAESITSNPSQLAADQRDTGKLFGVRFGREWRYPKFQFDAKRSTLPEMKAVLHALSPDEQGWDRLQWFLEPHETLNGRTPLEVWKSDRNKVIEAANTERWDGRD